MNIGRKAMVPMVIRPYGLFFFVLVMGWFWPNLDRFVAQFGKDQLGDYVSYLSSFRSVWHNNKIHQSQIPPNFFLRRTAALFFRFPGLRGGSRLGGPFHPRNFSQRNGTWSSVIHEPKKGKWVNFRGFCWWISVGVNWLVYIPRTQLTSIFEGQPDKNIPFSIKTRVIWVLGIYINIYIYMLFEIKLPQTWVT